MALEQAAVFTQEGFHALASALVPETRMFIDGKLLGSRSGERFETIHPANNEAIASVPLGGIEDVDLAPSLPRARHSEAACGRVWSRASEWRSSPGSPA